MPEKDLTSFFQSPVFFLLLAALWLTISWFISRRSGWSQLASAYPAPNSFSDASWRFQNIRFGDKASHRGVLNVSANSQGVCFSMFLPFRFGHRPFLVPWSDVQGYQNREQLLGLVIERVEIRFVKTPEVECSINGKLANELEQASAGAWQYRRIGQRIS